MKYLFALVLSISGTAYAGISYVDNERNDSFLRSLVQTMDRKIDPSGELIIKVAPCGQINAFTEPSGLSITMCTELIDAYRAKTEEAIKHGVDKTAAIDGYRGTVGFVMLHELGHALIIRHQIPVLGRNEDAADQFAANMLLPSTDGHPMVYIGATNFFAEKQRLVYWRSELDFVDEHDLRPQRRARLICWAYGKDPQQFGHLASLVGIAQSRFDLCKREYETMMRDSNRLFGVSYKNRVQ